MEKLELKHIVGYLPYRLDSQIIDTTDLRCGETCTLLGIFDLKNKLELRTSWGTFYNNQIIPILRPLSDLIKEIEVNGEKFVPIKKLGWEYYDGELGSITNCVYGESPKTTVNVMDYLYDLEQLYEWHLDIHGLIEKGLAIDINTLDNGIQ